jgi:hypothetical protein
LAHYRVYYWREIGLLSVVTFDHDPIAGLDDRFKLRRHPSGAAS